MSTANTNQKENTMPDFEHLVKCPSPPYSLFGVEKFHYVRRSESTIHERADGRFMVEDSRVGATIHTDPEQLVRMASDALLLAEHLRERQSALQAEKEAEKDAQALAKEARALFESIGNVDWHYTTGRGKAEYLTMARKAREIHGVTK